MRTVIKQNHPLYEYCLAQTSASKLLYNAALFRLRNHYTAHTKSSLTENENSVEHEIETLKATGYKVPDSSVLSYSTLEKLMRVTHNHDFFDRGLSMQTAQHVVKDAVNDFKNWLKALNAYKKDGAKFLGKPHMPGYCKSSLRTTEFTNQDCSFRDNELKFPYTTIRLKLELSKDASVKSVRFKPYYEGFLILTIYETKQVITNRDMPFSAGIDFGVDNIAAITTNEGHSLLFKGNVIKTENQYYNKERARLISIMTRGHDTKRNVTSHRLMRLSMFRDNFMRDQMHKISNRTVKFCIDHKVGTLVLGVNKLWKQNCAIGKVNNQKFTQIPLSMLVFMITYKAEREGIKVVLQEESYTSKADFLACDYIPVYGKDDKSVVFSGRRTHRGLYRSSTGMEINADLNGAANILRKALPNAFECVTDYTFLSKPQTIRFSDMNRKSIPDEGVVVA